LWLYSLKVAQLLRSAVCLHTNQSRSYLSHHVLSSSTKIYDLHYIRRFPECVTIPNDVGQISNYYFYFRVTLKALYIFKFLPVWSVYTINKSRKNLAALDSKGNLLSCLCNRT